MGVRYANRIDANQRLLVELWRRLGAQVLVLSAVGKGCPDVLLSYNGHTVLCELKDGSKPPSKRKLTEPQIEFHKTWLGQICIVKNEHEAAQLIYKMREHRAVEFMLQSGIENN